MPRRGKIPKRFDGGQKTPYESAAQFYRVTVLYPTIDTLLQEINERFSKSNLHILNQISKVIGSTDIDRLAGTEVYSYYKLSEESLLAELLCFTRMESIKEKDIEERARVCVEKELKLVFPHIFELFRLYFTIPMSSASCERSFSSLRRLKSYCRNTIGQERLSSLRILAIEREIPIDIEKIINVFDLSKNRRLLLS